MFSLTTSINELSTFYSSSLLGDIQYREVFLVNLQALNTVESALSENTEFKWVRIRRPYDPLINHH